MSRMSSFGARGPTMGGTDRRRGPPRGPARGPRPHLHGPKVQRRSYPCLDHSPAVDEGDEARVRTPKRGPIGVECRALSPDYLSRESCRRGFGEGPARRLPRPRSHRGSETQFAVENSSGCRGWESRQLPTTYPQPFHRRSRKDSHCGNSERLLHTGFGHTVNPSRGNAAPARRETGRQAKRDAPGAQDRGETRGDRTGSGSVKTGTQSRNLAGPRPPDRRTRKGPG